MFDENGNRVEVPDEQHQRAMETPKESPSARIATWVVISAIMLALIALIVAFVAYRRRRTGSDPASLLGSSSSASVRQAAFRFY